MPTVTIQADSAKGGFIEKKYDITLGTTTYSAGSTSLVMGYDHIGTGNFRYWWRGYASFDTSVIPDRSIITSVDFQNFLLINLKGGANPGTWQHLFYTGTFLGAGGPVVGDWGAAANFSGFKSWVGNPTSATLSMAFSLDKINKSGYTDYEIHDASLYSAPYSRWQTFWRDASGGGTNSSKLIVTYTRLRSMMVVT